MPRDVSTPVLVLGCHHGGLAIARSLGRWGVEAHVVESDATEPGLRSRYWRGHMTWSIRRSPVDQTLDLLIGYGRRLGRRPLLIPTTDDTALFVARHAETLSFAFRFPRLPLETVEALCNKRKLYYLATSLGVPTPFTTFPESVSEVDCFARDAQFPVMVKGIDGLRLERRTGRKMAIARTPEELRSLYSLLEEPGSPNLMLQEYIPGADDTIWMFNGYFDATSECRAAFTGRKLRQHPVHTGATSLGLCTANRRVAEQTIDFMQRIRYRGIIDIGWRFDARDESYKLLDPNPRIGSTFRLFCGLDGMDVARFLYCDLTGQALPVSVPAEGRKWLVEDRDLESVRDYMSEGTLTVREWVRSFRGVQETAWFARDDLAPFRTMLQRMCGRILRRTFRLGKTAGPGTEQPVAQSPSQHALAGPTIDSTPRSSPT